MYYCWYSFYLSNYLISFCSLSVCLIVSGPSFPIPLSLLQIVFSLYSNSSYFLLSTFFLTFIYLCAEVRGQLRGVGSLPHCMSLGVDPRSSCLAASVFLSFACILDFFVSVVCVLSFLSSSELWMLYSGRGLYFLSMCVHSCVLQPLPSIFSFLPVAGVQT